MGLCASQPKTVEWRGDKNTAKGAPGALAFVQDYSMRGKHKRGSTTTPHDSAQSSLGAAFIPKHIPEFNLNGMYNVLDLLGSGGGGETYLARDMRTDEQVAIKFIPR